MNGMTNREHLVEHQYRNAGNLEARIRFYERFSVNTRGWLPWVFDRLRLPHSRRVSVRVDQRTHQGARLGGLGPQGREP